jgi:hypothetical protein
MAKVPLMCGSDQANILILLEVNIRLVCANVWWLSHPNSLSTRAEFPVHRSRPSIRSMRLFECVWDLKWVQRYSDIVYDVCCMKVEHFILVVA